MSKLKLDFCSYSNVKSDAYKCYRCALLYSNRGVKINFLIIFMLNLLYNIAERWKCYKSIFWHFFSWNQSCQELFSPKPQHFHPNFFLTIFLVKSKLSTAKKSKTPTFSRVFHPKKSTNFKGNQNWIFGQKIKISNSACVQFA